VKTISLRKKVAAVAVASLGFGLLSVVPAQAAMTAAPTLTTLSRAGTATTPLIQGTAFTANLTVTTGTDAFANGETMIVTYTVTDPTGTEVKDATFTAADVATIADASSVSLSAAASGYSSGQAITVTSGAGTIEAAAYVIGTISFIPRMGGNYAVTSAVTGTAVDGTKTEMNGTSSAARGLLYTQGIAVTQGVTRGASGTAKIANQAKVTVTYPEAEGTTYKQVSSGVGAIIGATPTDAVNTNISGVATDFSAGLTTVTTSDATAHNNVLTLSSTAAGVQTITVTTVDTTTGLSSALYSITVTWSAIAALAPSASIVRIAPVATAANAQGSTGATANAYTTTLDAIPYSAPRAIGTNVATIQVILVNGDGTAATQGHTVTASVSGSGFVLTDVSGAAANGTARSESQVLTAGSENVAWIHVSGDGTAGTGTINITVTDVATGTSTALPSKTVTFYGAVTKLAATATNFTIGKAGQAVGGADATRTTAEELGATGTSITSTSTPAFVITATDSGGRGSTAAAVPVVISSDANVATGGTCVLDTYADADYSATPSNGGTSSTGVYNCNWSAAANAASGSKATLTVRIADPASTTGGFLTTTVAVSIGGSVATETLAFDKASYAPGEAFVITRTAKDSAGNPVFDGAASGAITFNKPVGGTAPAAKYYVGGVSASATSVAKSAVFAPSIPGAFSANMTGGDAAATVRTASASVTDANAGLLTQIDALNAKIVALNALIAKIMKKLGVK
jgi:protocatechuate 3,4-dioxygenase beta subunit